MSTWYAAELRCPGCAHAFAARLLRGGHVTRAPELREAALRGALNQAHCPGCDLAFPADRDVVYTDFDRGHWIHVAPPAELPRWAAVERAALGQFDRGLRGTAPLAAGVADRFQVRVVFETDELRERLLCWDAGLDDAVLECIKLRCLRERPAIRRPDERLRLRAIAADGALTLAATSLRGTGASWTVPRAARVAVAAERDSWQARFPALFGRGFISCDRYLLGADDELAPPTTRAPSTPGEP